MHVLFLFCFKIWSWRFARSAKVQVWGNLISHFDAHSSIIVLRHLSSLFFLYYYLIMFLDLSSCLPLINFRLLFSVLAVIWYVSTVRIITWATGCRFASSAIRWKAKRKRHNFYVEANIWFTVKTSQIIRLNFIL